MHLKLIDQQFKTVRYGCVCVCVCVFVYVYTHTYDAHIHTCVYTHIATQKSHGKHKPKICNRFIHQKNKKESKHNTKDSDQVTREDSKSIKEQQIKKKTTLQNNSNTI